MRDTGLEGAGRRQGPASESARKEERRGGSEGESRVGACVTWTLPIRARAIFSPLPLPHVSLLLCPSRGSLDIFIFVSNTCGVSGHDASLAVGLTIGIRGARFRVCVRASGAL